MTKFIALIILVLTSISTQADQSGIESCKSNNIKGLNIESAPDINVRNFSYSFEKNQVLWSAHIFIHNKKSFSFETRNPKTNTEIVEDINSSFINDTLVNQIFYTVGDINTYKPKAAYLDGDIRVLKKKLNNNDIDDERFATWTMVASDKVIFTRFHLIPTKKNSLKLSNNDVNETIQEFISNCDIWNSLEHDPLYNKDSPI